MKSSKNKIIFLLIALVIYLMWMTILIISLHNGYLKALIALLYFITYVFIGSQVFYTINFDILSRLKPRRISGTNVPCED